MVRYTDHLNNDMMVRSLIQGAIATIKRAVKKKGEQSLRNFDLSEYRRVINDVAIWIYGGVTKLMEEEVQPLLVPAIIEHEGIGCITGGTGEKNNKPVEGQDYIDPSE